MNDKIDKFDPSAVWQAALGELQMQLTGATFDTWLRRSSALTFEGDTLVVGVMNQYAQDWLEHRLLSTVQRTLTGIAGRAMMVRFVEQSHELPAVEGVPGAPMIAAPVIAPPAALPEMPELKLIGFVQVSHYERRFWLPFLNQTAWLLWLFVRAEDKRHEKTEWTPEIRRSAPPLGSECGCGSQSIVGVNRVTGRRRGALERLAETGAGRFWRQGKPGDPHTMYIVQVRVRLPLLTPVAVMQLSETLRLQHDRWLEEYGFDPRAWFVDAEVP